MATDQPETTNPDDTPGSRYSIGLLRRINAAWQPNEAQRKQFEDVLDAYAELPGPWVAAEDATMRIHLELRKVWEDMRIITGKREIK
jgi:hypothetical protein